MIRQISVTYWVGAALLTLGTSALMAQEDAATKQAEETAKQEETKKQGKAAQAFDPENMSEEDFRKMMEAMFEFPGGDEQRKHLEAFAGEWDTTTKMYMAGPQGPAAESKGSSSVKWVLGKRYLLEDHKGEMMGMPYEGMGLTGYDDAKNLFVSVWANNMSQEMLSMAGTRHPKTGVITMYGQMDEPALKMFGRMVKYVSTIVDEDTHVFEIYDLAAGDDYKVVEVEYKRKSE